MVVGVIVVVGLGGERKVVGWWQWRPREEVVWLGRWSGGGARGMVATVKRRRMAVNARRVKHHPKRR